MFFPHKLVGVCMIDEKLKELGKYIDSFNEMSVVDLCNLFFKYIESDQINNTNFFDKKTPLFHDLQQLKKDYKNEIEADEFTWILFQFLLMEMRSALIIDKARSLDIDPHLYKKDMGFLFKGKSL